MSFVMRRCLFSVIPGTTGDGMSKYILYQKIGSKLAKKPDAHDCAYPADFVAWRTIEE
jgi:hypothetical protein